MSHETNLVFKTGYQLGLAGKSPELTKTLNKYDSALKDLRSTRNEIIERSQDSISQSLHSIILLTNSMRNLLDQLEKDQINLLNTLSVKLATIEAYEGNPNKFMEEFRISIEKAYRIHNDKISEIITNLNKKLEDFRINKSVETLKEELIKHFNEQIENINQQLQLQLGFNKGESIAQQIKDLKGNGKDTPIIAVAMANTSSGIAPLVVKFKSQGSTQIKHGVISSFEWDYGDGNSSTSPDPIHTYANPGDYKAKLTVRNNGVEHFATIDINVTAPPAN